MGSPKGDSFTFGSPEVKESPPQDNHALGLSPASRNGYATLGQIKPKISGPIRKPQN